MRLHYSNCSLLTAFAGHLSFLVLRGPNMLSEDLSTPRSRRVQEDKLLSLMGVSEECMSCSFLLTFLTCFFSPTCSSFLPLPIKNHFCQWADLWVMFCLETVLNTKKNRITNTHQPTTQIYILGLKNYRKVVVDIVNTFLNLQSSTVSFYFFNYKSEVDYNMSFHES